MVGLRHLARKSSISVHCPTIYDAFVHYRIYSRALKIINPSKKVVGLTTSDSLYAVPVNSFTLTKFQREGLMFDLS